MKTIFVIKLFVILGITSMGPKNYSYSVRNTSNPRDTGIITSTIQYNIGDTVPIMEEKQIRVDIYPNSK